MDVFVRNYKPNSYKPLKGKTIGVACDKHGYIQGDHCPDCVEEKKGDGPAVHIFKPMVYNDICETPILIESKQHLRRECKKHNVQACRLM